MQSHVLKRKLLSVALVITLLLPLFAGVEPVGANVPASSINQEAEIGQEKAKEVMEALNSYSNMLSGATPTPKVTFSREMMNLVNRRKSFYATFFKQALHSTLQDIDSEFNLETQTESGVQISPLSEGQLSVKGEEIVTLYGKYDASPENHPMIQAAHWALNRATDKLVKTALESYIQNTTEDTQKSSTEGFEIVFILQHHLVMQDSTDGLQIVEDSFTDKSADNPSGIDNVIWKNNGEYFRTAPDYMNFVDYRIYHTSIETMGKEMLALYKEVYAVYDHPKHSNIENRHLTRWSSYDRSAATDYINTYTSNTSRKCRLFFHGGVVADQSKWNASYTKHPCNDCANYVSQAMLAGGIPTDGTWYPDSVAWKNTYELKDWLLAKGYASHVCWLPQYLNSGDLGLTNGGHIVMVGAVSPVRYSAHTNDRLLYSWNASTFPSQLIITY
jgi:hypothetical protein